LGILSIRTPKKEPTNNPKINKTKINTKNIISNFKENYLLRED